MLTASDQVSVLEADRPCARGWVEKSEKDHSGSSREVGTYGGSIK